MTTDPANIIHEVDEVYVPKILEHVAYLSSLGSRMTGYEGNERAADYIYQKFKDYNASKVWFEEFQVTVPLDLGANITITSSENGESIFFPAHIVYPNEVQTCKIQSEGMVGTLIYGGFGSLDDLQGKDVKDSIVVLEFNSGWNWRFALSLGAKAVIFLGNDDITRFEAETKCSSVPLYFPRLFVESKYADQLRFLSMKGNLVANLHSEMLWREVISKNVLAFIEGSQKGESTIVLMAHYDSLSFVPSLSPGASEILGAAALVELIHFFLDNPPAQNILLVATSGYHQGLVGSREFVEKHFIELRSKLVLAISLDISYETNTVVIRTGLRLGSAYQYNLITNWEVLYNYIARKIMVDYNPLITTRTGKEYNFFDVRTAPNMQEPYPTWLDSEPFAIATKGGGLGLCTYSIRPYYRSPSDTIDKMNSYSKSNVAEQVEYIYNVIYMFSLEPAIYSDLYPDRFSAQNYGFFTIRGQVWEYNVTSGWYQWIHGKTILHVTTIPTLGGAATYQTGSSTGGGTSATIGIQNVYLNTFITSDENGTFSIVGTQPGSTILVYAYLIDEETSKILYSIEIGSFKGSGQGGSYANPFVVNPTLQSGIAIIPVFRTASIAFSLVNNPLNCIWDSGVAMGVNNFYSHMPPVFCGTAHRASMDVVAFIPSGETVELLFYAGGQIISSLVNSSENSMMGKGYVVQNGAQLLITNPPLNALENLWFIDEYRLSMTQEKSITFSASATMFHGWATLLLNEAKDDLINKNYTLAYLKSLKGWSYEVSAHNASLVLIKDSINTSVFFFLLLIPFTLLTEKLMFETKTGARRVWSIIVIFLISMGILYYLHPGFTVATNTFVVLIGTAVSILCIISLFFLSEQTSKFLKERAIKVMGYHHAEIERISAVLWAISYGVSSMKKRKLRTVLTLFTIVIVCFSLVSFTSISILTSPRSTQKTLDFVNFNGVYIRKNVWAPPSQVFSPILYSDIAKEFGDNAIVSPRAWLYPSMTKIPITYNNKTSLDLRVLLALRPEEKDISFVNFAVKQGRWFFNDEEYINVCILNNRISQILGIDPQELQTGEVYVNVWGLQFKVIGIADTNLLNSLKNLDEESQGFLPAEIGGYEGTHVTADSVIIIPFGTAMRILGEGQLNSLGGIFNIAIGLSNATKDQILAYANEISYRLSIQVYAVYNKSVWFYTAYTSFYTAGWEILLPIFLLAALMIVNTMMGNVEERKREIQTYGSVGLSPLHVGGVFLAEALVYSVLGSVIGYLSGMAVVFSVNSLWGAVLPANFSSIFVIFAIFVAIVTTIGSSSYAMGTASKLITPSIERGWRMPTKPKGNEWFIPLPFRASKEELIGVFAYLMEYVDQHKYERVGVFQALDFWYEEDAKEQMTTRRLVLRVKLVPWDLPTFQRVNLDAVLPRGKETYELSLYILRESGFLETWVSSNYIFVDDLRSQLLLWRSLSLGEMQRYIKIGNERFKTRAA